MTRLKLGTHDTLTFLDFLEYSPKKSQPQTYLNDSIRNFVDVVRQSEFSQTSSHYSCPHKSKNNIQKSPTYAGPIYTIIVLLTMARHKKVCRRRRIYKPWIGLHSSPYYHHVLYFFHRQQWYFLSNRDDIYRGHKN